MSPGTNDFLAALALIPATGDTITPDAELELAFANLSSEAPEAPEPSLLRAYGRGWLFDYAAQRFVLRGSAPAVVSGTDQLRAWCEKTIQTTRYANEIYSDTTGVDAVDVLGEQYDAGSLADLGAAVVEALLQHDRITSIEDFAFTRESEDDDYVVASFTVVTDADELELEIPLDA